MKGWQTELGAKWDKNITTRAVTQDHGKDPDLLVSRLQVETLSRRELLSVPPENGRNGILPFNSQGTSD